MLKKEKLRAMKWSATFLFSISLNLVQVKRILRRLSRWAAVSQAGWALEKFLEMRTRRALERSRNLVRCDDPQRVVLI